jgi:hypothetical protein
LEFVRVLSSEGYLLVGTTIGNPDNYFTEDTLVEALSPHFELVAHRFEYLKPYTHAMTYLRRVGNRFVGNKILQKLIMFVRKSDGLANLGNFLGRIIGTPAVSNGAFLFKCKK